VHTSLSHEIGSIGLLERENATILNGALAGVARDVAGAMRAALTEHGLRPVTFFAQNDGTLMSLDQALRYPVLTIGSGPARSVGYLLQQEALVFGGTTPTLTDSAVAAGRADLGRRDGIGRHKRMLAEALARADVMLAEAIDRVKTSREDRPLIAVGGGSILV